LFEPGVLFRAAEPLAQRSFRGRGRVCANSLSIVLNPKRRKVSLTALQYSNQSGVWLWPLYANSSYTGQCRSPNGKNRPSATAYNTRQVSPLTEKLFAECILGLESELPYLDEKTTVRAGWPDLAKQRAPSSRELCGCVNLICITRIHIRTCYPMTVARYQF
jgi:hypothetical protein